MTKTKVEYRMIRMWPVTVEKLNMLGQEGWILCDKIEVSVAGNTEYPREYVDYLNRSFFYHLTFYRVVLD